MPSASSIQHNYYSSHHRRQSSQSQTSLPDQLSSSRPQVQSPNRSLVFLPSTAYNPPEQPHSRTPSASAGHLHSASVESEAPDGTTGDPHDFYRQNQDQLSSSSPGRLHQTALRTTPFDDTGLRTGRRKSSVASIQSQDERGPRGSRSFGSARQLYLVTKDSGPSQSSSNIPNPLRGRKASFKDLVARFDASPDEVPPLPSNPVSRGPSRTVSPIAYANSQPMVFSQAAAKSLHSRNTSRLNEFPAPPMVQPNAAEQQLRSHHNRPLFGEILAGSSAAVGAGYGITNARRRRGSEGSPMHSPNPMFPGVPSVAQPHLGQNSQASLFDGLPFVSGSDQHHLQIHHPVSHRRANSEFAATSGQAVLREAQSHLTRSRGDSAARTHHSRSHQRNASASRIPLSTRRLSLTSDSGPSAPSSRAASKLEQYQNSDLPASSSKNLSRPDQKRDRSNPHHKPRTPAHIQSPGRQGHNSIPPGEKSPSLRANIIAPPPKISPPLRSSRPRLPVSAASTAASRAKIAEKFQNMAKEQSDKNASLRRSRPPELSDIDLKARRLKITQALSRSREGNDLRSDPTAFRLSHASRSNSVTTSLTEEDHQTDKHLQQPTIPALVVEAANNNSNTRDEFHAPDETPSLLGNLFPRPAMSATLPHTRMMDGDSPTLGVSEDVPHSLPMQVQVQADDNAGDGDTTSRSMPTEMSISDIDTTVENDRQGVSKQPEVPALSMLHQVTELRQRDSASPLSEPSRSDAGVSEHSDHADQESVQFILRNTTYMDEDEAVEKGYRTYAPPPPVPRLFESSSNDRDSWTSSIAENSDVAVDSVQSAQQERPEVEPQTDPAAVTNGSFPGQTNVTNNSVRSTTASDAYTIVNIVLQRHSTSGVVDQQLVNYIYEQIVTGEPHLANSDAVDAQRVEELCLQQLQSYGSGWRNSTMNRTLSPVQNQNNENTNSENYGSEEHAERDKTSKIAPTEAEELLPPRAFRAHRYKSSLDSAEDWLDASPSVSDWMKFAAEPTPESEKPEAVSSSAQEPDRTLLVDSTGSRPLVDSPTEQGRPLSDISTDIEPDSQTFPPPPPPPSHTPPPRPISKTPSLDHKPLPQPISSWGPSDDRPPVPRRMTSISQMSTRTNTDSFQDELLGQTSVEDQVSKEQKRLKQRRHVLKELVDTEYSYERDLRVLCDIYKQTAVAALTEEDIKVIFGNIEQVQLFAKDFLTYLKLVVKPAYVMERPDRKKDQTRTSIPQSGQVSGSDATHTLDSDLTDVEKDLQTKVGQAFAQSLADMERVYTEYIRGRHAANKKLEHLQGTVSVREWLKECSDNSSDITNAWSLDALLVKPIQRITKYPLLLNQLLESTSLEHPDAGTLRKMALEVTDINMRINEVKKHTELVDQVLNRKRKESDVRNGLTKAFGRRAEKLRQHVGINEMYEDGEYARLRMDYDNNCVHLVIVSKDCQGYIEAIRSWVQRMCEFAAAAEAWVDVGHSSHAEAESKLRQLAMAVRGINSIALPDHVEGVLRKVIQPMERANLLLERFKTDPKGLIQKREKKLIDYNQVRNKRDRGEKLDRKMTERMDQWEALNREAKQRMRKLLYSTATLVQSCLGNLVQLHLLWLSMCKQKFSAAMAIPLDKLGDIDLVKEWQVDFDYQEASALALSICNGSLLAEAVNMVSFLTPGSTLNGDESPRQPSWNSGAKRSESLHSEGSHLPELTLRQLHGDYSAEGTSFGSGTSRLRAGSSASGKLARNAEMGGRGLGFSPQLSNGGSLARPGTSPSRSEASSSNAPRLSIDTPSPSLAAFRSHTPPHRPSSSSTFFSATAGPSQAATELPNPRVTSNIFSSALPMSDSPVEERNRGMGASEEPSLEPEVLFTAASVYEFNIDRSRQEGGIPYLTYVAGEIFDVIGERGELWLARNQDDPTRLVGWIWNKHFAKLAE